MLIANSFVFKEPVFNYSGDFPFLWDEIKIPVMFGSDYDLARNIIMEASDSIIKDYAEESSQSWSRLVNKYMIENISTNSIVTLTITDNWVEFTLRFVTNYKKRRATKNNLFTKILKDVEATANKVKFASATFQLVEPPEFSIKINNSKIE